MDEKKIEEAKGRPIPLKDLQWIDKIAYPLELCLLKTKTIVEFWKSHGQEVNFDQILHYLSDLCCIYMDKVWDIQAQKQQLTLPPTKKRASYIG